MELVGIQQRLHFHAARRGDHRMVAGGICNRRFRPREILCGRTLKVEKQILKQATSKKSIYGVHPGVAMTIKWIGELKQKTGRSLEEWMKFIKKEGPPTEQARRAWLKEQHGLGTNSAGWLAERSVGKGDDLGDPDAYLNAAEKYVEQMFAGKKEHLRPI